jgi:prolyl oligopeptidase
MTAYALPPASDVEMVVDHLHGVRIHDPYRWLEDGDSPRTRDWIERQTRYTRSYLDALPIRPSVKQRVTELLRIDGLPEIQKFGNRWFSLRRRADEDQASIYMSDRLDGPAERVVDPLRVGGPGTSVQIRSVSPNGRLLAYAVRAGASGCKAIQLLDLETRDVLPDRLPTGFIRGFAFAPDSGSFYYTRQGVGMDPPVRAVRYHRLGSPIDEDRVVWLAGEDSALRLIASFHEDCRWGVYVLMRAGRRPRLEYHLHDLRSGEPPQLVVAGGEHELDVRLHGDRWFVCTNRGAPNRSIGWTPMRHPDFEHLHIVVPERQARISRWQIQRDRLVVSYVEDMAARLTVVGLDGRPLGDVPLPGAGSAEVLHALPHEPEIYFAFESFTHPPAIYSYSLDTATIRPIAREDVAVLHDDIDARHVWYPSSGDTRVHMFLVGRRAAFETGPVPVVLTGYGASGTCLTPAFSQMATLLAEQGGIFAVANLRGGSELGASWYEAGRARNRQNAINDFVAAAEWLIANGVTTPDMLAIAGGSNSGTLVGAALTQRPELFRAVLCLAPLLDMIRYHRFESMQFHVANLGNPDDPDDFRALAAYSPYHAVRAGVPYPAVFLLSGDADTRCDPMHARKMTAQLQAATSSSRPVLLHYSTLAGHSAGYPLSLRIESLTDRIAFLWEQLGVDMTPVAGAEGR